MELLEPSIESAGFHLSHRTCKHQDKISIMTAEESKEYMAKTEVHQLFEVRTTNKKAGTRA